MTKDAAGNNIYHDVRAELTLIIATSPTATSGTEVAEAQGSYVTPQAHHWTFEKSGTFKATQNYSGRYLNLVMWAYSPSNPTQCWTFPRSSLPAPQQPRDCGLDVYYNRGHLSVSAPVPPAWLPPARRRSLLRNSAARACQRRSPPTLRSPTAASPPSTSSLFRARSGP